MITISYLHPNRGSWKAVVPKMVKLTCSSQVKPILESKISDAPSDFQTNKTPQMNHNKKQNQQMLNNWSDLRFSGNIWPKHWTQQRKDAAEKRSKTMPEEFLQLYTTAGSYSGKCYGFHCKSQISWVHLVSAGTIFWISLSVQDNIEARS